MTIQPAVSVRRLWLVRLGKVGEGEPLALDNSLLSIGFGMKSDLRVAKDRAAILKFVNQASPDASPARASNIAAQVNQFVNVMAMGDVVISPLKRSGLIAIGQVEGPYAQLEDGHPARKVRWLRKDVPRDAFKQDLLFSFGAIMTVCEVKRNDALRRVLAVVATGDDPGDGVTPDMSSTDEPITVAPADVEQAIDLDRIARDQIERRISSVFSGHGFTRLIAAILRPQGYEVHLSPPGPDLGIDIVAGRGAHGFDSPRLVVQVKSGSIVIDQPTLQSLIGSVQDAHADHGLLVAWSGFKQSVVRRTNELYFRVRLWGREEVMNALFGVYDRLPEEIRADLPLRRTWTLVPDDTEDDR